MTHQEFNKLYETDQITIKIFQGIVDQEERIIESFTWQGRYYLRIHKVYRYITNERSNGKKYNMTKESHIIKEFETKDQANSYFKKLSDGKLKRIK